MITWHDTREKANFDVSSVTTSFLSSYNDSVTFDGGDFAAQTMVSSSFATELFSEGVNYRTIAWQKHFTEANDAGSSSAGQTYEEQGATSNSSFTFSSSFTLHAAGDTPTGQTTAGESESTGTNDTFNPSPTTFLTSTTTAGTSYYTVTSTARFRTSGITSTVTGGISSWTTRDKTVTLTSTRDSGFGIFTDSSTYEALAVVASASSGTPIELGTVYATNEPNEWLWMATYTPITALATATAGAIVKNSAASFTRRTAWPTYMDSALSYAEYSAGQSGDTYSRNVATSGTYFLRDTMISGTNSVTLTSGDQFRRDTYTTEVDDNSTRLSSITFAIDESTFTAFGTISDNTYVESTATATYPGLIAHDGTNSTTSAFSTTYARLGIQNYTTANPNVYATFDEGMTASQFGDVSYTASSRMRVGKEATSAVRMAPIMLAHPADSGLNHERVAVPVQGGLQHPNSRGIFWDVGTNLAATPRIYYPFTSSAIRGVVVPVIYRERMSANDALSGLSWFYEWNQDSSILTFTRQGSGVVHSNSTGSVSFATQGAQHTYFSTTHENRIMGGFGDYNQQRNSFYRGPNAYKRTRIDESGQTSTSTTVEQAFTSNTISSGIAIYEERLPFRIPAAPIGGREPTVLVFVRNFADAFDT